MEHGHPQLQQQLKPRLLQAATEQQPTSAELYDAETRANAADPTRAENFRSNLLCSSCRLVRNFS